MKENVDIKVMIIKQVKDWPVGTEVTCLAEPSPYFFSSSEPDFVRFVSGTILKKEWTETEKNKYVRSLEIGRNSWNSKITQVDPYCLSTTRCPPSDFSLFYSECLLYHERIKKENATKYEKKLTEVKDSSP